MHRVDDSSRLTPTPYRWTLIFDYLSVFLIEILNLINFNEFIVNYVKHFYFGFKFVFRFWWFFPDYCCFLFSALFSALFSTLRSWSRFWFRFFERITWNWRYFSKLWSWFTISIRELVRVLSTSIFWIRFLSKLWLFCFN